MSVAFIGKIDSHHMGHQNVCVLIICDDNALDYSTSRIITTSDQCLLADPNLAKLSEKSFPQHTSFITIKHMNYHKLYLMEMETFLWKMKHGYCMQESILFFLGH
ncbi:hypothetical protein ACJX0J_006261, partial [Zea mays]